MPARSTSYMKFFLCSCSWKLQLYVNKRESKMRFANCTAVLFTTLIANLCSLFENLRIYSAAEPGIVFNLFLNFEQK